MSSLILVIKKLLGIGHILLGLSQIIFFIWSYFFIEPKLMDFYNNYMSIEYATSPKWYLILVIVAIINFIFAHALLQGRKLKLLLLGSILFLGISSFLFLYVGFMKYSNVPATVYDPEGYLYFPF